MSVGICRGLRKVSDTYTHTHTQTNTNEPNKKQERLKVAMILTVWGSAMRASLRLAGLYLSPGSVRDPG